MRAAFGLIGLLVGVGVLLFVFSRTGLETAKEARKAQDEVRQISGRGEDNRPAIESVTLEPQTRNGQLTGLLVKGVEAGGAMEKRFGLRAGDVVVEVGPMAVSAMLGDEELARGQLQSAYAAAGQSVVVLRGGQRMTLPQTGQPAPAAGPAPAVPRAGTPPASPTPARSPRDQAQGVVDQLQSR